MPDEEKGPEGGFVGFMQDFFNGRARLESEIAELEELWASRDTMDRGAKNQVFSDLFEKRIALRQYEALDKTLFPVLETIFAPVKSAASLTQRGVEGAKKGTQAVKEDLGRAKEGTQSIGRGIGDIFTQLRGVSAQTHADPNADRGAFMDAIFALDEQGFAPMLIGLAEVLGGMTAEGSKASPRAREAERFAGR
jgi:hypothetical protein